MDARVEAVALRHRDSSQCLKTNSVGYKAEVTNCITSQRLQLEGLDVRCSSIVGSCPIIILNEMDEIQDCQHPRKAGFLAVPERRRNDA
jgi:hypothetical protein